MCARGKKLGEFYQWGPKPGEERSKLEFRGRVPGYVNEAIVISNRYERDQHDVATISLIFANRRCDFVDEALLQYLPKRRDVTAKELEQLYEQKNKMVPYW